MTITDLEEKVLELSVPEKKRLLRRIIKDLDATADNGSADKAWLQEAQRRHRELTDDVVQAVPAEKAIAEARERLHNGSSTTS